MVLLAITNTILKALDACQALEPTLSLSKPDDGEPDLADAQVGKPISHGQIIEIRDKLRSRGRHEFTLERLLVGSRVYIPPPPPKPEPTEEYKALMARLRREEEERAYERMINPPAPKETFSQQFPQARSFAAVNQPHSKADLGGDAEDVTYSDVHRQLMLLLNFLVSIIGVAATLWVLARWWSTPARLFLAMGGSVVVGVAEVGLYYFYTWHLVDASKKDKKITELKEIVQTWVVEGHDDSKSVVLDGIKGSAGFQPGDAGTVRKRKKV